MASQTLSAEQSTGEKHIYDNSIASDEKSIMTTEITDLPMEVLIYLLNKLDNYADLKSCTMVSRIFFAASSWLLEGRQCFVFNGDENESQRSRGKNSECIKSVKKYGGINESYVRLRKCSAISCKWLKRNITSEVSCLELNCCRLHWKKLLNLLIRFENLEELTITMNVRTPNCKPPVSEALDHMTSFMGSMEDLELSDAQQQIISFVMDLQWAGKRPKAILRKLNVDIMFANATSFLIMLILYLYDDKIALEEFSVKIHYEEIKLLMYEKSEYFEHPYGGLINIPGIADAYAPVKCADLLRTCQATLKKLSFCCSSNFPYAGGWPTVADPDEDMYYESALRQRLSEGLFEDLFKSDEETQWTFPNLQLLSINIPLLLISYETQLLDYIEILVKSNPHVKNLVLKGLNFKDDEECLIRNKFLLPSTKCSLGLKAVSVKPGNLTYFSNELEEITMDVMGDYKRTFDSLFRKNKSKSENNVPIVYKNLKYFSAANGSLQMPSYGFTNLLPQFPNLTELYLRDLSQVRHDIQPMEQKRFGCAIAEFTDRDMQSIFQNLKSLQKLHLHCGMFDVTDQGLTGIKRKVCLQLLRKKGFDFYIKKTDKIGLSFSALKNLKYLFLYYTGSGITEITARFAFKGLHHLEYFNFDSCSLNYRDRFMMYKKILVASPSCHIDTFSKTLFSDKIIGE